MIFFLVALLVYVSIVDVETRVIADGVTLVGILAALNYQLFFGDIHASVLGLTAGIGVVWIMNIAEWQKLGGGDAKLMGLIGACTNWHIAIGTVLVAYLISLPYKNDLRRRGMKSYAYAPFATIGFIAWNAIFYLKI